MGIDHDWVAIRSIVEEGLRDAWMPGADEPLTEESIQTTADTVTDHLAAALSNGILVKKPRWWRRH